MNAFRQFYEKLSRRERIMLLGVGALLPLALLMFLVVYVGGQLSDRDEMIASLESEQRSLQLRLARGRQAQRRMAVYREESPPADPMKSLLAYQDWLAELSGEVFGPANFNLQKNQTQTIRLGTEGVLEKQTFTLGSAGSLHQVVEFLYRFYQARLLHRFNSITLTPETEGQGTRQTATGRLRVTCMIEVAVVLSGDPDREFVVEPREYMPRTLEDYRNVVVRRNLFGPPNNPPRFTTSSRQEFETGDDIVIDLKAEDDGADPLEFELIETSTSGARLEMVSDARATLKLPELPKGTHRFTVRATDNGWPAKSGDLQLQVSIDDPPPVVAEEPPPKPVYARFAFISGITTNIENKPEVWIRLQQPDDEVLRLTAGETFELDGATWTILEIGKDFVFIQVGDEKRKYRVRSTLDKPEDPVVSTAASG